MREVSICNIDKKVVGERIRSCRKNKRLTQCALAEKLDYASERQLHRVESGELSCSVDKLMEIAQVLEVSTDYLLLGEQAGNGFQKYFEGKIEKQAEYLRRILETAAEGLGLLQWVF